MNDQHNAVATSETTRTLNTIHTIHSLTHSFQQGGNEKDDYDGKMIFEDLWA